MHLKIQTDYMDSLMIQDYFSLTQERHVDSGSGNTEQQRYHDL